MNHEHSPFTSLASLGRRFLAFFLDSLILFIPCAIAGRILPYFGGLVVWFFYGPVLESSAIQATLGKYLMGIQVTDLMGRRLSLRTSVIRNFVKFASTLLLFIGFLFALFTQRKQALHDLLADSLVVYGRSDRSVADAWTESVKDLFRLGKQLTESSSTLSQLERLQSLREKGVLTEEEFLEEKRKILSGNSSHESERKNDHVV